MKSNKRNYRKQMESNLRNLIECLKLLCSNPSIQIAALPDFVVVADELVLIFDDLFVLVDQFVEEGLINAQQAEHLRRLQRHARLLTELQDPDLWTNESLFLSPLWSQHREIAREALTSFGERGGNFTLDWLSYLPLDE